MSEKAKNRPQRTPLNRKHVLAAKSRPGFHRCYVNEEPGNVEAYLAAGYTIVEGEENALKDKGVQDTSQLGSAVRHTVNRNPNASSRTAILMEIPQEWFDEDQAAKQKELDIQEMTWNPDEVQKWNPALYGELQDKTG